MYRRPAPRQKIHTASLVRPTKDDVRRILKIVPREEREEPSKVSRFKFRTVSKTHKKKL